MAALPAPVVADPFRIIFWLGGPVLFGKAIDGLSFIEILLECTNVMMWIVIHMNA